MSKRNKPIDNTNLEKSFLQNDSVQFIAGFDEAGRGPLAGPVSIGMVIFDRDFLFSNIPPDLEQINDSKKIPQYKRATLAKSISVYAKFSCSIHINSRIVDRLNINGAIELGIISALNRSARIGLKADIALLDGNYNFKKLKLLHSGCQVHSIVKGDQTVFSIAAASILAKTSRDNRMIKYDKIFPGYGLAAHKGYGTLKHREAIKSFGLCPIHRRSFRIK